MNLRVARAVLVAVLLFLAVQVGALALVGPFEAADYRAVDDPTDPTNSAFYLGAILVATALMLAAFRFDFDRVVRWVVVLAGGLLSWYVFSVVAPVVTVAGVNVAPLALAAAVVVALLVHPEWYVIDAAGVVMGAGGAGLFGISFGPLPALVLLVALAVYDAVSVYGTEHMLSLASGVLDLRVPVVLVIPLTLSYSLLEADFDANDPAERADGPAPNPDGGTTDETDETDETAGSATDESREDGSGSGTGGAGADGTGAVGASADDPDAAAGGGDDDGDGDLDPGREAFFIGLGDAVMPAVLVASAATFSPAPALGVPLVPAANLPALAAMVGILLGLGVLLWAVLKGRPHAGLPLLNGGAIGGYLLGSVAAGVDLATAVGL
jgi:presenilin-like A22 family membrane protease